MGTVPPATFLMHMGAEDCTSVLLARPARANGTTHVAVATAMVGAIMFGLDQGNFGSVQGFQGFLEEWCQGSYDNGEPYACTHDGAAKNHAWQTIFVLWGGSVITVGAALGGLSLGPVLATNYGRRLCMAVGAASCFTGCLLAAYLSYGSPTIFMIGRFVTGFGVGVCCLALPMYNSEIVTREIRGTTGSMFQLNVVVGGLVATSVTMVNHDWRFGMMLPGFAAAVVSIAVVFIPESPRWVMRAHGYNAGVEALRKVRDGDVEGEARAIHEQMEIEKAVGRVSYCGLFRKPALRKRVLIACYLQIAQQLTGVNAFLSYASVIFMGVGISDPLVFNAVWNAVMLSGCVSGLIAIDSSMGGRRIQLIGATGAMGPSLIFAGCALHFQWSGIIITIMLCIYGFGFQFAWGIIPWVYPDEIFTMAEKASALSLTLFWQYAINACVNIGTPYLVDWSKAGTLFIFGALNMTNMIFVLAFIKETKGVALEDVPALFCVPSTSRENRPQVLQ